MTALTDTEVLTRVLTVTVVGLVVAVGLTVGLVRWANRRGDRS